MAARPGSRISANRSGRGASRHTGFLSVAPTTPRPHNPASRAIWLLPAMVLDWASVLIDRRVKAFR